MFSRSSPFQGRNDFVHWSKESGQTLGPKQGLRTHRSMQRNKHDNRLSFTASTLSFLAKHEEHYNVCLSIFPFSFLFYFLSSICIIFLPTPQYFHQHCYLFSILINKHLSVYYDLAPINCLRYSAMMTIYWSVCHKCIWILWLSDYSSAETCFFLMIITMLN